ncbi:MAG: cytochrome c oxidase subunit II [Acidobacteriota bacterium]
MQHSLMDYITGQAMLPPRGSEFAGEVDVVFLGIYWLSIVLFLGITIPALYFSWRYRYKPGRITPHQTHNTTLEILWSVGPLIICVALFFWGLNGYMKFSVAPGDAMEVVVTGKQWLWQFEYPDGSRTVNELHVPINKPVKFTMTSEDVLHDFFVPDMRVKHDIVPGRYTQIWFTPNVLGPHTFTCAEYCGKDHSGMKGILMVDTQEDFEKFVATGGTEWISFRDEGRMAEWGKLQYERKGCNSCHSVDGTAGKGPSWKGIFGKSESFTTGPNVTVDADYLRESMMMPQAKIVKGFEPIMPTFQGSLRPQDVLGLIEYIKSLQ